VERVPDHLAPVLEQLMRGHTDVTASRRLNISPRTFSRRVAELLDYLGVQTRFQGGMEVARLARAERPGSPAVSPPRPVPPPRRTP
jgi:DNA-binding NarL/FixJ family response regulator